MPGNALFLALYPSVSACRDGWGALQFEPLLKLCECERLSPEDTADVIRKAALLERVRQEVEAERHEAEEAMRRVKGQSAHRH